VGLRMLAAEHVGLLMGGRGMNRKRNLSPRAARVLRGAAVVLMLMAAGGAAVALGASSDPSASPTALSPADEAQIASTVDAYFAADDFSASTTGLQGRSVSRTSRAAAKARRNAVYSQVLTSDLSDEQAGTDTMADFAAVYMAARSIQIVRAEHAIRSMALVGSAEGGGVTYHVTVWLGSTERVWDDASQTYTERLRKDDTPEYDITLVSQDGVWRISAIAQVVVSEDASATQYGPTTPHVSVSAQPGM